MPATVLIVDDSATMRGALKAYLADPALTLAEADSAERALALVRLLRPEVALVDLQLPGMNGLELAARLRASTPTRILLVTGEEGDGWEEKSRDAGAVGLIRKPVNPAALKARVLELALGRTS